MAKGNDITEKIIELLVVICMEEIIGNQILLLSLNGVNAFLRPILREGTNNEKSTIINGFACNLKILFNLRIFGKEMKSCSIMPEFIFLRPVKFCNIR
jgi:hypothetical protein